MTNNSNKTLLDRELLTEALRHMSEADLRYLNHMVVERLKLLTQARSTVQLAQFAQGDRISFTTRDGTELHGTIVRLNKKTVSLRADDGSLWKVSPGLLRKSDPRNRPDDEHNLERIALDLLGNRHADK